MTDFCPAASASPGQRVLHPAALAQRPRFVDSGGKRIRGIDSPTEWRRGRRARSRVGLVSAGQVGCSAGAGARRGGVGRQHPEVRRAIIAPACTRCNSCANRFTTSHPAQRFTAPHPCTGHSGKLPLCGADPERRARLAPRVSTLLRLGRRAPLGRARGARWYRRIIVSCHPRSRDSYHPRPRRLFSGGSSLRLDARHPLNLTQSPRRILNGHTWAKCIYDNES